MNQTLPTPEVNFKSSSGVRLLTQGFMLHVATIAGPVDVFRKKGQKIKATKLFFNEYGLNLILFLLLQVLIWQNLSSHYLLSQIGAVSFLILLSIVQMFVDSVRKPIRIYHSSEYEAGISVRLAGDKCWAFFNHYALPVGRKHGVNLRSELHRQAQRNKFLLFCYAQNVDVAEYYMKENPQGVMHLGESRRPLLVWDYREDADKVFSPFQKTNKVDLFGFSSNRNSGSLPL